MYTEQQQTPSPSHRPIRRSLVALFIAACLIISTLWVFHSMVHPNQGPASAGQAKPQQEPQQYQQQTVSTPAGVYVGGADGIGRIDVHTGRPLWQYNYSSLQLFGDLYTQKIIPIGNTVYVSMQSFTQNVKPTLLAIDARSGKLRWSYDFTNLSLADLSSAGNLLYVATNPEQAPSTVTKGNGNTKLPAPNIASSTIYALNAADGTLHASYSISGTVQTLSITNGVIYMSTTNGLQAFRLATGKLLWYTIVNAQQVSITPPHIVGNVLYTTINNVSESAGQSTAVVAAFKADTGEKLWQSDPISSQLFDIAVANNEVFVGTMSASTPFTGDLRAYDEQSGKLRWKTLVDGAVEWAPAVQGDTVYVSAYADLKQPEEVAALNTTNGSIQWKAMVAAGVMTSPTVVNGVVYVAIGYNGPGTVTALKATDGHQLWTTPSASSPEALVVVG